MCHKRNIFSKFIMLLLCFLIMGQPCLYKNPNAFAEEQKNKHLIAEVKTSVFSDTDNTYNIGSMVKIEVRGRFQASDIKEGTVRIASASQRYDSGLKKLTISEDGTYLFCHWDAWGLKKADDYRVTVTLTDKVGQITTDSKTIISLTSEPILRNLLITNVDVGVSDRGLSLRMVRNYMVSTGYNGVLGRKWTHSYNVHLQEWPDGTVKIFEALGGASWYLQNSEGAYKGRLDDHSILSKNPDSILQRRHKDGIIEKFDSKGRLRSISDHNNNQLTFDYDKKDLLVSITSPSGRVIRLTYDSHNRISSIVDPTGKKVIYKYDESGNLVSVINQAGFETKYAYDSSHRLITITNVKGHHTAFTYDRQGRLSTEMNDRGNNAFHYQYSQTEPKITITNASGENTVITYNDHGDIVAITDPLGNTTRYSYDYAKNLANIVDANGNSVEFTYDERGNLVGVKDPSGNITTLAYDKEYNKVIALTDALKRITQFRYNSRGDLIETIFSDGSSEKYAYGEFGNLITKTDRKGNTINYQYDVQGRLIKKTYPDSSKISNIYDDTGNLLAIKDKNGTIRYEYDILNRVTKVIYPGRKIIRYQYDAAGNRTLMVDPNENVLNYIYDEIDRLIQIKRGFDEVLVNYKYDKAGRRIERELANSVSTTYMYDKAGRLVDLVNRKASGEVISRFSYTHDKVGNRLTMTTDKGTHYYSYDNNYQLTKVVYPDGKKVEYDYDCLGNRISVRTEGRSIQYLTNNLNQYTSVGGVEYRYDANGNLIWDGKNTYEYDYENRLIKVKTPKETISCYTYDPFGKRISKTNSNGSIYYLWDNDHIVMEINKEGNRLASYFYGDGIDEILSMQRGAKTFYYTHDALRSVTNLLDLDGNIVESYEYDAFGQPNILSSIGNPYMFTGREYESETGFYFYRARYYDPIVGRFLTIDPVGFVGGINLYHYVSNSPVNFNDPLGLYDWTIVVISTIGGAIQGAVIGAIRGAIVGGTTFLFISGPVFMGFGASGGAIAGAIGGFFFGAGVGFVTGLVEGFIGMPELNGVGSEIGGQTFSGDPTFHQPLKGRIDLKVHKVKEGKASSNIIARIIVPYENSLVRGKVPIFGLAYGKDFKEYRVGYGQGKNPKDWILIKKSTIQQAKDVTPADLDDSADITIHGNLATWDTGLKSYVYLPDYPPDHPVDLNGAYTLRLVVIGKNGEIAEDRVTVEVGEAIPNAWGGIVRSKGKRVTLNIPEQSLMDSFRVISIKPIEGKDIRLPENYKLIGNIYEFREPGERFTKDAILKMEYSEEDPRGFDLNQLGIYGYNPEKKEWVYLESTRNEKKKKIITVVRELYPYYAIYASDRKGEGSVIEGFSLKATRSRQLKTVEAVADGGFYLVRNAFEDGRGEWSNRDGDVGAEVSLDNTATYDGTYCLKLTNTNYGGNFASNILRTPFDAREYPMIQLDYKIPPGVKINFFAKVNGRWYEVGFTDDYNEYKYKRVNIANIGRIEGVIADNNWHTARFNLHEMLRTKTRNYIVEEMIMADWDVGGYMKLKFGNNSKGATYFIDNFIIRKEVPVGLRIDDEVLLIDNFNQKKDSNALGGRTNVFVDSIGGDVRLSFVSDNNTPNREGHALKISYDVSKTGSFAGYLTRLENLDLREYNALSFIVKGSKGGEVLKVGLKDSSDNESKVFVNDYLPQGVSTTWQRVEIPLVAFSNIKGWKAIENLSFSFENIHGGSEGVVFLDDIQFEKDLKSFMVNNFEIDNERNLLGGRSWTFSNGAAAINGGYDKGSLNKAYRISYGGNIGDLFTYARWTTQLQGIDVSQRESLSLLIKGADGGEEPNIYLDDGTFRWGVEVNRYKPITTSWQKVTIPLKDFSDYGVDLTHIEELQVVFEWKRMSGTIYLDDVQFNCSERQLKEK